MNSWKSTLLSAWAPPLSTFIIGTGRSGRASAPPRKRYRRLARLRGGGARDRQRDAEDRVGAEPGLVRGPVEVDQGAVDRPLLGGAGADERVGDVSLTFETALAPPCRPRPRPRRAARWPRTRRSRRRREPRHARGARVERHLDLDRRVSPRVEDLAGVDALDRCIDGGDARGSLRCPRPARGSARGGPQGELGVDAQAAREVDEREQRLADPALGRLAVSPASAILGSGSRAREPGRLGAALDLASVKERRQVLGHVGERLARPAPLLLALDAVPVREHLARRSPPRLRRTRAGGGGSASATVPRRPRRGFPAPRSSSSSARK